LKKSDLFGLLFAISSPFFLNFNADCEFRIAMSPEDLGKAGLDELGKKRS